MEKSVKGITLPPWVAKILSVAIDVFKDKAADIQRTFTVQTASGLYKTVKLHIDYEHSHIIGATLTVDGTVVLTALNPSTDHPLINDIIGVITEFVLKYFWKFTDATEPDQALKAFSGQNSEPVTAFQFYHFFTSLTSKHPVLKKAFKNGDIVFRNDALRSALDIV